MHYEIGDKFQDIEDDDNMSYILAQSAFHMVCLIGLDDGNRWTELVRVDDLFHITEEEFRRIAADEPERFIKLTEEVK